MNRPWYAHTAATTDGGSDRDESHWQGLADHLRNVADLAAKFAAPAGPEAVAEAHLAGLLHDLGKYRAEFQAYLRGERAGGQETQHAIYGAAWAWAAELVAAPFAVAGHHAGLHDRHELEANVTKSQVTGAVQTLVEKLQAELGPLSKPPAVPAILEASAQPELAADVYIRLLFSCLVDADRLDTAHWPDAAPPDRALEAQSLLARVLAERDRKQSANPDSPIADTTRPA